MPINEHTYHLKGRDDFVTKNHFHDEIEIIHVINGEGSVLKSNASYPLKSEHLYLIDARCPHIVHPINIETYTRSKIVMDARSFFAFMREIGFEDPEELFLLPPVCTAGFPWIDSLFERVDTLLRTGNACDAAFAYAYVLQILQFANSHAGQTANEPDVFLKRVLDALNKGPRPIETIARELSYSKYYLCHRFKEKTGTTVSFYLSEKLYEQACQLLADKTKSISEIAFSLGFQSAPSFTRFFKKKSGRSPSECRKRL